MQQRNSFGNISNAFKTTTNFTSINTEKLGGLPSTAAGNPGSGRNRDYNLNSKIKEDHTVDAMNYN